jgi:hypothetical protein
MIISFNGIPVLLALITGSSEAKGLKLAESGQTAYFTVSLKEPRFQFVFTVQPSAPMRDPTSFDAEKSPANSEDLISVATARSASAVEAVSIRLSGAQKKAPSSTDRRKQLIR